MPCVYQKCPLHALLSPPRCCFEIFSLAVDIPCTRSFFSLLFSKFPLNRPFSIGKFSEKFGRARPRRLPRLSIVFPHSPLFCPPVCRYFSLRDEFGGVQGLFIFEDFPPVAKSLLNFKFFPLRLAGWNLMYRWIFYQDLAVQILW